MVCQGHWLIPYLGIYQPEYFLMCWKYYPKVKDNVVNVNSLDEEIDSLDEEFKSMFRDKGAKKG